MAQKSWQKHVAPHVKKAMKSAMATARKSWTGAKQPTAAQKKRIKTLQNQRDSVNRQIRKLKGKD